MNGADGRGEPEWPIDPRKQERVESNPPPRTATTVRSGAGRRGFAPILVALGGVIALLLLLWLIAGRGNSDQDKLTNGSATTAAADDREKLCASKQTYDLIKRELFRRAAQVRGSDQAAFDRLSAYAALRMENPVMESEDKDSGAVSCSASLSLDLPPGVAVVGGRRSLSADVDYSVRAAADDSGNVLTLRNAEAIITPLATLARTGQPAPAQPQPSPGTDSLGQPMGNVPPAAPPAVQQQPPANIPREETPPPPPRETATARPSFNCDNARTRGEIAVCNDSGLASLDRQMASQFNSAMSDASPGERAMLQQTRGRFLAYRDRCRSDGCIADAYRGRMREIRDIVEGRWQPR